MKIILILFLMPFSVYGSNISKDLLVKNCKEEMIADTLLGQKNQFPKLKTLETNIKTLLVFSCKDYLISITEGEILAITKKEGNRVFLAKDIKFRKELITLWKKSPNYIVVSSEEVFQVPVQKSKKRKVIKKTKRN